jgi:Family of unknown function (DUF5681)
MRRKKEKGQDAYQVGYGRPPLHSRFRRGKSGNPTGRPRRGEADRAQMLIWKEAYRLLTVREGDKVTRMPVLQAVWRSLLASAAKGNVSAVRAVIKFVHDVEAENQARRTGAATRKLKKDVNEMTDEELMAILTTAQHDKC